MLNAGNGDLLLFIGPATDFFQHLAVTFDGATLATYLNGQLVDYGEWVGAPELGFEALRIGLDRTGLMPFAGVVDETQVFNRPLTADEVQQTFLAGAAGFSKNHPPVAVAAASPNPAEATGPDGRDRPARRHGFERSGRRCPDLHVARGRDDARHRQHAAGRCCRLART